MKVCFILATLSVAVLLFAALPSIQTSSASPTDLHSIGRFPIHRGEPLRIRSVKIKGKRIKRDTKFAGNGDWLKTLTITIRNASSKRILFGSIDLVFPPPPGSDLLTIDQINYGQSALSIRPPSAEESRNGIAPNQSVDIQLSAKDYDRISALLMMAGYERTPHVTLKVGMVIFEDDSAWYGGNFRRDPDDPRGWLNTNLPAHSGLILSGRPQQTDKAINESQSSGVQLALFPWNFAKDIVMPEFGNLLRPVSYRTPQQSANCYNKAWTGKKTCSWGGQCETKRELSDTAPGGFQFQNGNAICEDVQEDYCGMGFTTVAIPCSFSGGGGGGGGGGGMGESEPCSDDWECDFGYSCTSEGFCQDEWLLNQ